jgi:transcriptional regulator with XRE-family HTH domain
VNFAEVIRTARNASGLSQSELAAKAACSKNAIWNIERGKGSMALLVSVLGALDVQIAGLPRGQSFADQIKTLRLRRGWTQIRLAASAKISPMTVYRLERGDARMAALEAATNVLAPKARVAREGGGQWIGGERDCRFTPQDMLVRIYAVLGKIGLDPSADRRSAVIADRYFYREDDGLQQTWTADAVFCNPPFSMTTAFIRKASESWANGDARVVMLLVPVHTQLSVFHELCPQADVFFLRGGIKFDTAEGPGKDKAPFSLMLILFGADQGMIERTLANFACRHLPRLG